MSILPERNNAQYQPLTIVLRSIIRDYQAGGGILLELCQNADDAGASEIVFVLDDREHPKKDILHDGLAQYQGVSLLAFNNKPFKPEDFASLRRIGDSGKAEDPNSTGKFGKGFNSVYNWTDSPSILSGTSLLILDPHESWSATPEVNQPGGPVYNFVKHSHLPKMRNQLSAFDSILKDFDKGFDGAIIRIPLRTEAQAARSKIVSASKYTAPKEVEEVFRTFSGELVKSLLFLKNLNTITLKIGEKVYAHAQATTEFLKSPSLVGGSLSAKARKKKNRQNKREGNAAVNKAYTQVFVEKTAPSWEMDFFVKISLQNQEYPLGNEQRFKYAVSHILGQGPKDDEGLWAWARKNKLFPWTAIAAPLEESAKFNGSLFSTLPLPINTNHPVHIHGMFSITTDRRRLHSGDWTTNQDSEAKQGAKWNEWLFSEYVPKTWLRNLECLRDISEQGESGFRAWDFWPAGSNEEWKTGESGDVTRVLGNVFKRAVENDLRLLPTVCGTTGTRQDVLFTLDGVDCYESAFKDAGVAVVAPPHAKTYELMRLNTHNLLTGLTPCAVRERLALGNNIENLPQDSRMLLLDYAISDGDYRKIGLCRAPLIPVKDGTFQSFCVSREKKTRPIFLPRDENEVQLFGKHTRIVDVDMLLPGTAEVMRKNINNLDRHTEISKWTMDAAARYCEKHIFPCADTDIIRKEGLDQFVDRLWQWIIQQNEPSSSVVRSPLWNMWLIPLMDREYRKLGSTVQILDVSGNGGIGAFIWKMAKQYGIRCALFTGEGISQETVAYLRLCGFLPHRGDLEDLMVWLVANSEIFVDRLSSEEKRLLLRHLSGLASDCSASKRKKVMRDTVASLRIFSISRRFTNSGSRAVPVANDVDSNEWTSMNGVDAHHRPVTYIGVKNIPVTLRVPGTVFVNIEDPDTTRLIDTLEMAHCPQPLEILQRYIVPGIVNTEDDKWGGGCQAAIEYALQNFEILSVKCKAELSQAKIVPVPGPAGEILRKIPGDTLEPNSPVVPLFFSDEYKVAAEPFCRRYRDQLLRLGMVGSINNKVILERIGEYGNSNRSRPPEDIAEKAQLLITTCTPPPFTSAISQLSWIPALSLDNKMHLYSPGKCRGPKSGSLVKYALPLVSFPISNAWNSHLGWDQPLPQPVILRQLEGAVKADDIASLEYLIKNKHISAEEFPNELNTVAWIPSTTGAYYSPANIFLDDFKNLSPHLGTLNSQFQKYAVPFFSKIGVETAPSLQRLKELQNMLAEKSPLEQKELDVALSVVQEVGRRYPKKGNDLHDFKAPDTAGRMHDISKLTAADPGASETHLTILHHGISLVTVKQLGLATSADRYLGQLNDPLYETDFAQKSPKEVIDDTLRRSSTRSIFTEYLANAEDCGSATMICWILDDSDYLKTGLLSPGLADVHGPALFCHNNGKFSTNDFRSIMDIGAGSKQGDPSKIGRFGKGALTMYHWTSVPSFISGEYFVIFDPEQNHLPEHPTTGKPRTGMKIKIGELREKWREQLRPFEGIEGFNSESLSFSGTLFRFPLPRSKIKGKVSILEARAILESYYDEANLSLLFLKNIHNISFRDKKSPLANWSVSSRADAVAGKSQFSHLTIDGEYPSKSGRNKSVHREWCVISGKRDDIPKRVSKIKVKPRLEARYSLAALWSETPLGVFCGRYFVDLPLNLSNNVGLPVHVNANLVLHSDRQSIPIAQGEDGAVWNRWILEAGVAPLYLDLVQHLMEVRGTDGYRHWPKYQPLNPESVSKVLAMAFWKSVALGTDNLYPPDRLSPDLESTANRCTPTILNLREATFNLLDVQADSNFFLSLLLELGLKTIVTPTETVRNGLKEFRPKLLMESISPEFVLSQFRGSPTNSKRLLEIWGRDHNHSIVYLNQLLSFIFNGVPLSSLVGCELLPLANCTFGVFDVFSRETGDQVYLMAETPEERDILRISESLMVHPGLDSSIVYKLSSQSSLNVRNFQPDDIKELYPRLDIDGRDDEYRKEWLVKVWSCLKTSARSCPGTEQASLARLRDMRMYFGKSLGGVSDDAIFLCPSEFNNFAYAAILKPSRVTKEVAAVIKSFKGLILLDSSAFPESAVQEESLQNVKGVYRLLKSIELLASMDEPQTIETYITRAIPDSIQTLRKIFSPAIISELIKKYPQAREYLRELPLWPSTNSKNPIHKPATSALLPPYPRLSLSGMTNDDIFVDAAVAQQYSEQLTHLSVDRMTIDIFLKKYVRVVQGHQIQDKSAPYFKDLINTLSSVCPQVFSKLPLGVDGNGRFQWLDLLYSPDEPIFTAAFRDPSNFLREDFRRFPAWKHLVQKITEASYLACARSIQERGAGPQTDNGLLADARTVFEYLCHEERDQGMREWSIPTWRELTGIAFAPAKTVFVNPHHRHRTPRMRELLAGKTLTNIVDAIFPDEMDFAWSQCPILEKRPSLLVIKRLPISGLSACTVFNHLKFLSQNRENVDADQIWDYVEDIKKSYQWLQDIRPSEDHFLATPETMIWFNVDMSEIPNMTRGGFQASWLPSQSLCLGLEQDSPPLRYARSFLAPYHKLMSYCGVRRVTAPVIPPSLHSAISHTALVTNGLQKLRDEEWSLDVKIVLGDRKFRAHCAVLCAISKYWHRKLRAIAGETEKTYTFPDSSKVLPESVSALLDYIYTGKVLNIELSGRYSEDLHKILDQIYLSDKWELDELKAQLEISLCKGSWIRPDFIRTILKCAEHVGAKDLLGICNRYVQDNREIVHQPGFAVPSWDWYPTTRDRV